MKKYLYVLIAWMLPLCSIHAQAPVWNPDNGNGTFTNPIMWGDWPDPDVIRVGDDFYFVSTSMHYVPGCPIATSKDLVNWKMAGYAVDRYDEDARYDLKGGDRYLRGSWAATIRHHNGKFYVGFCTPSWEGEGPGHFSICIADDVKGPWERTIFPEYLYDPGLLFDDDGKVYVFHGQGTLYVTELASDAKSVKGEKVKIWDKRFKNAHEFGGGYGMEGAHAYKINGKYYLTCPAGGTEGWQICLRSDNIYGPYEHKLIMNDSGSYPPNGLHQGGMVQLKNGDWWFIIMQDRGPIGRVPHLVPVKWVDGWPMLGSGGKELCEKEGKTLFWSSNFSLGVAIFSAVNKYLAKIMNQFPAYDVTMSETHHIHKLDAPSGTAITLAEGILENLDRKSHWVKEEAATTDELPIHSIREGEVFGIHTVRYDSAADSISITHDAKNRGGFALGAILAAEYTAGKQGYLGMSDLFPFLADEPSKPSSK